MKKLLLSMAVTASMTGAAFAADLPVKARAMAPAPVVATSWTGCYVGAGGGYGLWNQEHQRLAPATLGAISGSSTSGGRGWFGTVQVGCDYQFADRWVIGAFGDWDFGRERGTLNLPGTTLYGDETLKYSWAAGARLGYVVLPRLLTYVAGGYTQARFDGVNFINTVAPIVPTAVSMDAQTYRGWFIGTGYEYALDFIPGLYWKTEYRFSQFKAENVGIFTTTTVAGVTGTVLSEYLRSEKYNHTVRSELVYRFNFGGPVVAKY